MFAATEAPSVLPVGARTFEVPGRIFHPSAANVVAPDIGGDGSLELGCLHGALVLEQTPNPLKGFLIAVLEKPGEVRQEEVIGGIPQRVALKGDIIEKDEELKDKAKEEGVAIIWSSWP